jgi:hypothetical protein
VAVNFFSAPAGAETFATKGVRKRTEHCDGAENSPRGAENAPLNYTKYNFLYFQFSP